MKYYRLIDANESDVTGYARVDDTGMGTALVINDSTGNQNTLKIQIKKVGVYLLDYDVETSTGRILQMSNLYLPLTEEQYLIAIGTL